VRIGVLLLVLAFTACSAPGAPAASATTPPAAAAPSPDLQPFVGDWGRHGFDLKITRDGSFTFAWRTYRFCGQFPPPCDRMVNNSIVDGGQATGTEHAVAARSAAGQVAATNDATVVPAATFVADVTAYQLLTVRFPSITLTLCGADFAKVAPAQVVQADPCGA
jgi:hypothetical protein